MKKRPVDENKISVRIPKDNKENSSHQRLLPKDTVTVRKVYWSFGFKFFRQIDLFGLDNSSVSWFVSVLDRFSDVSKLEYTGQTQVLEDGYRYHEINWDSKNIPLQRNDFNWIPGQYLNNQFEYPFCQFQISKGTGRVVGFWDENNIFQIIILDPLHNLQPSKYTEYELRECYPAKSQFDSLQYDIEELKRIVCNVDGCLTQKKLSQIPSEKNDTNIIVAYLDNEFHSRYKDILKTKTITEIIEAGVIMLLS